MDSTIPDAIARNLQTLRSRAEDLMRLRCWEQAALFWEQIPDRPVGDELKRRLSNNLASLQKHRPAVYQQLIALPAQARFSISPSAAGPLTIVAGRDDGSSICFSNDSDPVGTVRRLLPQIRQRTQSGEAIGLCGIGDGYLLDALTLHPPKLMLDMEQAVFLCEPEPHVLLLCLMIHDYSGPRGPIEQERVRWFIGTDWQRQLRDAADEEPMIGMPAVMLMQGLDGTRIQAGVQQVIDAIVAQDQRDAAEIAAYYSTRTDAQIAEPLSEDPSVKPRVLLLTTRFSTVLQYSTRDAAEAFESLGWSARVVIEPSPSHRVYRPALRRIIAEFKPDLVFQLDHLRHEHGDAFPQNLPFACWIQDHLQTLKQPQAAKSIGRNDFVLTDAGPIYANTFGYPARQCVPMAKVTRGAAAGTFDRSFEQDEDLVFVSNASHVPQALLQERLDTYSGTAAGRAILAAAGEQIIETYRAGDNAVSTFEELCGILSSIAQAAPTPITTGEAHAMADWLFHPLNDALYRQQAIHWAARAADELGLSLALYGKGWDKNPEFSKLARGSIEYGPALDDLTRRARINLQVVPYLCLHQRLLDGLVAGGFYLIRSHTADIACGELLDFLHARNLLNAQSFREADLAVDLQDREHFHRLTIACRPAIATSPGDDPVATVLDWYRAGCLVPGEGVLPMFEENSFSDEASLRASIQRYIKDRDARNQIAGRQRQCILDRLTYEAGLRRAMAKMHGLLCESQTPELQIEMMEAIPA